MPYLRFFNDGLDTRKLLFKDVVLKVGSEAAFITISPSIKECPFVYDEDTDFIYFVSLVKALSPAALSNLNIGDTMTVEEISNLPEQTIKFTITSSNYIAPAREYDVTVTFTPTL